MKSLSLIPLLIFLVCACTEPEIKVIKVPIDQPVDTVYIEQACRETQHFTAFSFAMDSMSSSYEVELYRSTCLQYGRYSLKFDSDKATAQPLEVLVYKGYSLVGWKTVYVNRENELHITSTGFDSIRLKYINTTNKESAVWLHWIEVKKIE